MSRTQLYSEHNMPYIVYMIICLMVKTFINQSQPKSIRLTEAAEAEPRQRAAANRSPSMAMVNYQQHL